MAQQQFANEGSKSKQNGINTPVGFNSAVGQWQCMQKNLAGATFYPKETSVVWAQQCSKK
eukprot:15342640-Ditylum_brightwellii.AAC.1